MSMNAVCRDVRAKFSMPSAVSRLDTHYITTLIAASVSRSIFPPLIQFLHATLEFLLPQSGVDFIVPFTKPVAEPKPSAYVWRVIFDIPVQVRSAVRARIQNRKRANKSEHVCALSRCRLFGIIRCSGMQEWYLQTLFSASLLLCLANIRHPWAVHLGTRLAFPRSKLDSRINPLICYSAITFSHNSRYEIHRGSSLTCRCYTGSRDCRR